MSAQAAHQVAQASAPRPVSDRAEADLLVNHMIDVMEALLAIVEKETALVRTGRLGEAARLEPTKSELTRLYLTDTARLKLSHGYLAGAMPDKLADLRARHDLFHALLQMNLTVLATAHAVSESIMRGVSDELARKATPQGYGASGRAAVPGANGAQPLTVSRVL
jgi:hypothetical protein